MKLVEVCHGKKSLGVDVDGIVLEQSPTVGFI